MTWKPIKGYEGLYEVSDTGEVRSLDRDVLCKNGVTKHLRGKVLQHAYLYGYPLVTLWKGNKSRSQQVHRLVADAFLTRPDNENVYVVDHKNGVKTDNRVQNLEYVTYAENNLRAYRLGLKSGAKRRLTLEQAREIRASSESGDSLAAKYGVAKSTVSMIRHNRIYKEVPSGSNL